MKRSEIAFDILRVPLDFLAVLLGFFLGYELRLKGDFIPGHQFDLNPEQLLPLAEYFKFSLIFAGMFIAVFILFGLYNLKNTEKLSSELKKILTHSVIWLLVMLAYFFIIREVFFSRLVLGFSFAITVGIIMGGRIILSMIENRLLAMGIGRRKVLLIGANKISRRIAEKFIKDPHYKVAGYLVARHAKIDGLKKLGTIKDLAKVVRRYKIEEIVQTSQNLTEIQDHEILAFCQENHLQYRFVPDILAVERSNVEIVPVAGYPLIHLKPTPLDGWGKVYKRIFDIFASGIGILLLSPLLTAVAIGIKLDSKGPILFSRLDDGSPACRVGQHGKTFQFFKFRTMKHKTHNMRYCELAEKNSRGKGPLVKIKDDPRITRLGKFLRRTSIDELPQLWNVFIGHMSLVGPRPHLPEEVEKYENHHKFLLTIKPGITGLSQINGRSNLDFETEVRLDSYYIKHWTPFFDLKILLKTVFVVLGGHAAD